LAQSTLKRVLIKTKQTLNGYIIVCFTRELESTLDKVIRLDIIIIKHLMSSIILSVLWIHSVIELRDEKKNPPQKLYKIMWIHFYDVLELSYVQMRFYFQIFISYFTRIMFHVCFKTTILWRIYNFFFLRFWTAVVQCYCKVRLLEDAQGLQTLLNKNLCSISWSLIKTY
jgi:hypothetical protein